MRFVISYNNGFCRCFFPRQQKEHIQRGYAFLSAGFYDFKNQLPNFERQ
jgi:hypothetical protein